MSKQDLDFMFSCIRPFIPPKMGLTDKQLDEDFALGDDEDRKEVIKERTRRRAAQVHAEHLKEDGRKYGNR